MSPPPATPIASPKTPATPPPPESSAQPPAQPPPGTPTAAAVRALDWHIPPRSSRLVVFEQRSFEIPLLPKILNRLRCAPKNFRRRFRHKWRGHRPARPHDVNLLASLKRMLQLPL